MLLVIPLAPGEQRDDEDEVGPGPEIGEVTERETDRKAGEAFAHVVEVPGGAPEPTAEDLAVAGLNVLGLDDSQELAVGPALKPVLLQVAAARDAPTEEEKKARSDQPHVGPTGRESGVRIRGHTPQGKNVQPAVDDEAAPDQLEAELFVNQVVGVELAALEDEVVKNVEGEERRIEKDAGIEVVAEPFVVPDGSG